MANTAYELAKDQYAQIGVDTDSAIAKLKNNAISKKSSVDIIALIISIFYTSGI